jgi:type-F conjugative transfer system pilin assembly thiol-disulfide isomerase TrbB
MKIMRQIYRAIAVFLLTLSAGLPVKAAMQHQYAIVFLFQGTCVHCQTFAPKLKRFTEQYALPTYAFTLDGRSLPEYPVPIPATEEVVHTFLTPGDNVPATFLINVNSRKYVKVSFGDVSFAELEQSINGIMSDAAILEAME